MEDGDKAAVTAIEPVAPDEDEATTGVVQNLLHNADALSQACDDKARSVRRKFAALRARLGESRYSLGEEATKR